MEARRNPTPASPAARLRLSVLFFFAMLGGAATATAATIVASADTYVDSKTDGVNFGSAPTAFVGRAFFIVVPVRDRGLLEFPLPALPVADVESARLRIFVDTTSSSPFDLPITVALLSASFVENTVTWDTQPGVLAAPIATANMTTLAGEWFEMNVTALVDAALQSGDPTHLRVRLAASDESINDDTNFAFRTKEFGTGAFAPQLIITISAATAPLLSKTAIAGLALVLFGLGLLAMRRGTSLLARHGPSLRVAR